MRFRALYTRQKTQKTKRWADGFLVCGDFGQVKLLDEEGKELASDFKHVKVILRKCREDEVS